MELKEYKKALVYQKHVTYNGIEYIPGPWITDISPDKTHWVHSVQLKDLRANSVIIARLEDVSIKT